MALTPITRRIAAIVSLAVATCSPLPSYAVHLAQSRPPNKAAAMAAVAACVLPKLTENRAADAKILAERGFTIEWKEAFSTRPEGTVTGPEARRENGRCVATYTTSLGLPGRKPKPPPVVVAPPVARPPVGVPPVVTPPPERLAEVPRLTGHDIGAARAMVERRFRLSATYVEDIATRDEVTAQSLPAGHRAPLGSPIEVHVSDGSLTAVPPVTGMSQPDAENVLGRYSLRARIAGERETNDPPGTVLRQNPPVAARVKRNSVVEVVLAVAPPPPVPWIKVPDVTGIPIEDAGGRLGSAGFRPRVRERVEDGAAPGIVIRQSPTGDTSVERPGVVELAVSTGIPVPDVVGKTVDEARAVLREFAMFAPENPGARRVTSQQPLAGERVAARSQVNLELEPTPPQPPPPPVIVPDVVEQPLSRAHELLAAAGLRVGSVRTMEDKAAPEIVREQTPAAGATVEKDAQVALAVSTGLRVPDVLGRSQAEAEDALRPFNVATEAAKHDDPAGSVIAQSPAAETFVAGGSIVKLTLSAGKPVPPVPPREQPVPPPWWKRFLDPWGAYVLGAIAAVLLWPAVKAVVRKIVDWPKPPPPPTTVLGRIDPGESRTQLDREAPAGPALRIAARLEHAPAEETLPEGVSR